MATKTDSFIDLLRETYLIQAADLRAVGEEVDARWYESLVTTLEQYTDLTDDAAVLAASDFIAAELDRAQYSLIHDREDEAFRTFSWVKSQWSARQ